MVPTHRIGWGITMGFASEDEPQGKLPGNCAKIVMVDIKINSGPVVLVLFDGMILGLSTTSSSILFPLLLALMFLPF